VTDVDSSTKRWISNFQRIAGCSSKQCRPKRMGSLKRMEETLDGSAGQMLFGTS